MSRNLTAPNITQSEASYLKDIVLINAAFDTPVYVHSSVGSIPFGGDTYTGVGHLGAISAARESEKLGPLALTLTLSGVDPELLTEGLDAGNYGDVITMYNGYRLDDGTLADDPWLVWRGRYEFAMISAGDENEISITVQHELAVLDEIDGARFTDEDQKQIYAADDGFEYVHEQSTLKLIWAGRTTQYGRTTDTIPPPGFELP